MFKEWEIGLTSTYSRAEVLKRWMTKKRSSEFLRDEMEYFQVGKILKKSMTKKSHQNF